VIKGTPHQGLFAATLGFFFGFAAVALFGPSAARFQEVMGLSPVAVGFLVAMPSLSGSLLRIPFAAWVDTTGGRKPFLVLMTTALVGMAGLTAVVVVSYPQRMAGTYPILLVLALLCGCGIATFSVGIGQVSYWFPQKRQGGALAVFAGFGNLAPGLFSFLIPIALSAIGLGGAYVAWTAFLALGTALYLTLGRNAWYFQFVQAGREPAAARIEAAEHGQELFPAASLKDSLRVSSRVWRTWALVIVYFTTFGGFIALTAWLPTYWTKYHGTSLVVAGALTALYSLLTSLVRVVGGMLSDFLQEGGENTAILFLFVALAGALVMTMAHDFELAVPGVVLLAVGMGFTNAAVFKIVPQAVPSAVGGAAGWVGGMGAFGGFVIPPILGLAVRNLGERGYPIGFITFVFLALISLVMVWILKYAPPAPRSPSSKSTPATGR
jgi:MFS transporter, NNP family, nitrate/nitrite transporter